MKRWLTIILLLVWAGIAWGQTTPPMCSITGNVANPDGSPYIGVIKFDSSIVQIINNIPVNPMQVSTATSPAGVINPISLPQGAFFKVTMCPNASSSSGCAATFTAIVPTGPTANFGNMAMGTNLSPGSSITASSLSVSGPSTLSGVVTFPDGSTATTAGLNNVKALGIGAPASTSAGDPLQITGNLNNGFNGNITNSSSGTAANAGFSLTNDTGKSGWMVLNSSTYTAQGPAEPANALQIGLSTPGPIVIGTNFTTSPGPPINFWSGSSEVLQIAGTAQPNIGLNILTGSLYLNGVNQFQSGTWTPQLQFGGAAVGQVPSVVNGTWAISGHVGVVSFVLALANKGTSTGAATIAGLPPGAYPATATNFYGTCSNVGGITVAAGEHIYPQFGGSGGPPGVFNIMADNGATPQALLNDGNFSTSPNLQCTIAYTQ